MKIVISLSVSILLIVLLAIYIINSNSNPSTNANLNSDLGEALNDLGVDTNPGKRVDPNQEELPDNFSPLGSSASFGSADEFSNESSANPSKELFLIGAELKGSNKLTLVEKTGVEISQNDGSINEGQTAVIKSFDNANHAWVTDTQSSGAQSNNNQTIRDATAADIDGDGFEELVAVYLDLDDRIVKARLIKRQADDSVTDTLSEDNISAGEGVLDVAVTAGDFTGDGADELAVVLSYADKSELLLVENQSGDLKVVDTKSLTTVLTDARRSAELATGNLDYDSPNELVVVLNELTGSSNLIGAARYFIFDDAKSSYAELKSGDVQGRDGTLYTAQVSDVSLGDIDADGLAEIVFGGLTEFKGSCDGFSALFVALDDAEHNHKALGGKHIDGFFRKCPAYAGWRIRFVHVNTLDLDGDGVKEIQGNQYVFEDFSEGGIWNQVYQIPDDEILHPNRDAESPYFTSTTTHIVAADVTNDGREDILTYAQWREDVRIFGLSMVEGAGFARFTKIETNFYNAQTNIKPILVPVNIDVDGPVLSYSEAEYQLVFTEPLIVAALAAPPCSKTIGQNWQICTTSFGKSTSTGVDAELTVSVKASSYVGVKTGANIPFVGEVGADFKQTVTKTASLSVGGSYTLEKTVIYTTGALEDSVIFTTIPYDQYTYTILSHPDPELMGKKLVVSMPREPITLIAQREFYNATVTDENIKIDNRVFEHSAGDVASYPSKSKKDQILRDAGLLAPLYQNGPKSVGQGSGETELSLTVSDEIRVGGSLGIEYETSVDVTSGPALGGFSVGVGVEASFGITSGRSTSYVGRIGSVDAANFGQNQYSFGMFTYTQEVGGQEFEVINYWVE